MRWLIFNASRFQLLIIPSNFYTRTTISCLKEVQITQGGIKENRAEKRGKQIETKKENEKRKNKGKDRLRNN
jgi:hypothetical protein